MSQHSQPLPISHLYAIADRLAIPEPFDLPPFPQNTQGPQVGHAGSVPPNQYSHDSLPQIPTGPLPATVARTAPVQGALAAGYQLHGISNTSILYPAMLYPPPAQCSYIAILKSLNIGTNRIWPDSVLALLAVIEPQVLHGTGDADDKRRAFWKVWVDLNWPGLGVDQRSNGAIIHAMARALSIYTWFKGHETMEEALREFSRIKGIVKKYRDKNCQQNTLVIRAVVAQQVSNILYASEVKKAHAQTQSQAQAQLEALRR
jgi:hypothetical protein